MLLNGITVYNGYSFGRAFLLKEKKIKISNKLIKFKNIEREINSFNNSYKKTLYQLNKIKNLSSNNKDRKLLFEGYILILKDDILKKDIINLIRKKLFKSELAIDIVIKKQIKKINNSNNSYIKERINDLLDISKRLIYNVKNIKLIDLNSIVFKDKTIIVSNDLSPSQIIQFDLKKISGFIIENGSITSHSSIISKSIELVSILGVNNATKYIKNDDYLIIDGIKNLIYINPEKKILSKLKKKFNLFKQNKKNLLKLKKLSAITYDGYKIKLLSNISNNNDIDNIFKYGSEGVGLYRTEFLFMDRNDFPNENEQFLSYKKIIKSMKNKIVTIRTVDLGGDKFLSYMNFPKEDVPFLGWRSIRIYKDRTDILETQLKAIFRASIYGRVRILFPMIISMEEVYFIKEQINKIKFYLNKNNISYNNKIKIGAMIETPSSCIISSHMADEMDFFSIGTNDLTQFILAVDRNNLNVSNLYNPLSPSVLNLIKYTINSVHEKNKKIGMCGELASDLKSIKLLLGLGLDELSMNVSYIPDVKNIIRSSYMSSCKKLVDKILNKKTINEIKYILSKEI